MEISRFSIIGDVQGIGITVILDNGQVLHKLYNDSVEATNDNAISAETLRSLIVNRHRQVKLGNSPESLKIGFNYQDGHGNVSRKEVTVEDCEDNGENFLTTNDDGEYRTFRYDRIRGRVTIIE